jgi:hypothetical protein
MAEWINQWLAAKRDVNATTRASYESVVRLHLLPHLGDIQLDRLTAQHVAQMFDAIEARNAEPKLRHSDARCSQSQVEGDAADAAQDFEGPRAGAPRRDRAPAA